MLKKEDKHLSHIPLLRVHGNLYPLQTPRAEDVAFDSARWVGEAL